LSGKTGTKSSKQKQKQSQRVATQAQPAVSSEQLRLAQEAKRADRLQRQAQARAAAERRKRARQLRNVAIGAVAALLIAAGIGWMWWTEENRPGDSVSIMVSEPHLGAGEAPPAYNSNPPTSGRHVGGLPEWKVYTEPITKELQVHALEDGAVVINYQPELDKATVDRLASIAGIYHNMTGGRRHLVMAPYPPGELSHPIVLTTWGRIDRLETFDEARIRRFIDEYIGIDHHRGNEGRRIP
jgi:hypothetical protein